MPLGKHLSISVVELNQIVLFSLTTPILMEEITDQCAGLKLSEREGNELDLAPIAREHDYVLVGKFSTKRRVNLESVSRVLKTI